MLDPIFASEPSSIQPLQGPALTQEQALEFCRRLIPEKADFIRLERTHCVGAQHGNMDEFYIWDHSSWRMPAILANSTVSWNHAISQIIADHESGFQPDNSSTEVRYDA